VQFYTALKLAWDDYHTAILCIRDVLRYMDQVYVPATNLEPSYNMALGLFRDKIVRFSTIQEQLKATLVHLIYNEQREEIIEKSTLKGIYQMLIHLGMGTRRVYEEDCETPLLKHLADFYQRRSLILLAENNASQYIGKVSALIDGVAPWIAECFGEPTKKHVVQVLEDELIAKHMVTIVTMENSGVVHMLKSGRYDQLEMIYECFKRFPDGISMISDYVRNYWRELRTAIETENGEEEQNPNATVQSLLNLKDKFNSSLVIVIKYDKKVEQQIQMEFEQLVNAKQTIAECLSYMVDDTLKKGIESVSEQEVIELFKTMMFLHYGKEKVVFEQCYEYFTRQMHGMITHVNEGENMDAYVKVIVNKNG
jgi:cullin 3